MSIPARHVRPSFDEQLAVIHRDLDTLIQTPRQSSSPMNAARSAVIAAAKAWSRRSEVDAAALVTRLDAAVSNLERLERGL
jgi:hypothetical protein